mgnify:CR=1 FL=1
MNKQELIKKIIDYVDNVNIGKSSAKIESKINKAIKLLVNKGFLLIKPSTGEIHVSLNPKMKRGIYDFIEKNEKRGYKF